MYCTCIFNCYIFCSFWDLLVSKMSLTIRNWRKLYWPDFFSEFAPDCAYLRSIALICARNYGHVFCSKSLSGIENARYFWFWPRSWIYARLPQEYRVGKNNLTIEDPGIFKHIYCLVDWFIYPICWFIYVSICWRIYTNLLFNLLVEFSICKWL